MLKFFDSSPLDSQLKTTPLDSQLTITPLDSQLTTTPLDSQLTTTTLDSQLTTISTRFFTTRLSTHDYSTRLSTTTPLDSQLTTTPLDSQLTTTPLDSQLTTISTRFFTTRLSTYKSPTRLFRWRLLIHFLGHLYSIDTTRYDTICDINFQVIRDSVYYKIFVGYLANYYSFTLSKKKLLRFVIRVLRIHYYCLLARLSRYIFLHCAIFSVCVTRKTWPQLFPKIYVLSSWTRKWYTIEVLWNSGNSHAQLWSQRPYAR